MRGIIIYPNMRRTPDGGLRITQGQVDPVMLRRAALYWDRIDHPQSNIVYLGPSPDEVLLQDAGVLLRTRVEMHGRGDFVDVLRTPALALIQHQSAEPGQWALAQSSADVLLPPALSEPTRALEIELHESLPVPDASVPIYDILQFRHRRRDELLAFRSAMDQIYRRALASPDNLRGQDAAVLEVENALINVHRVVDETPWTRIRTNLKVELSLKDAALGAMAVTHPMTLGGVAAAIKLGDAIVAGFKDPLPGLRDYAYLGYAIKDLGAMRAGVSRKNLAKIVTNDGGANSLQGRSKIGRNDPCFCGSGKKYKKCHGAPT